MKIGLVSCLQGKLFLFGCRTISAGYLYCICQGSSTVMRFIAGAPQVKDAEIGYGGESTGSHPSSFIGVYDYGNAFYTFSSGLGTFIVLNCYTSSDVGSNQYNFLIETLEGIERDVTPWVLVMLHCPLYNTFFAHQNETQTVRMKENFEKIFVAYNVNIVFFCAHAWIFAK